MDQRSVETEETETEEESREEPDLAYRLNAWLDNLSKPQIG